MPRTARPKLALVGPARRSEQHWHAACADRSSIASDGLSQNGLRRRARGASTPVAAYDGRRSGWRTSELGAPAIWRSVHGRTASAKRDAPRRRPARRLPMRPAPRSRPNRGPARAPAPTWPHRAQTLPRRKTHRQRVPRADDGARTQRMAPEPGPMLGQDAGSPRGTAARPAPIVPRPQPATRRPPDPPVVAAQPPPRDDREACSWVDFVRLGSRAGVGRRMRAQPHPRPRAQVHPIRPPLTQRRPRPRPVRQRHLRRSPRPRRLRARPGPSSPRRRPPTAPRRRSVTCSTMSRRTGRSVGERMMRTVRSAPKGVVATVGVLLALLLYWRIRR